MHLFSIACLVLTWPVILDLPGFTWRCFALHLLFVLVGTLCFAIYFALSRRVTRCAQCLGPRLFTGQGRPIAHLSTGVRSGGVKVTNNAGPSHSARPTILDAAISRNGRLMKD